MYLDEARRGTYARRGSLARTMIGSLVTLAIAACGGGGGSSGSTGSTSSGNGGSGSGGSSGSGSANASVLIATGKAISATVSPADAAPSLQVNLSIESPPASGLYYSTTDLGTAVASASTNWSSDLVNGVQSGALIVTLDAPPFIGSGVYHDTVTVEVCTDAKCANQIAGSPVAVAVTYTVTGNAVSNAGYNIVPTSIALEALSSAAAPTAAIDVTAYDLPPYGAYVSYASLSAGPVASMSFKQTSAEAEPYAYGTGVLTVNMKTPATLGPGTYNDIVTLSICYDRACSKPAVGSPYKIPITYIITASAGREFQQRIIQQDLTALTVGPTGAILYGTTSPGKLPSGSTTPPQLIQINPATGAITSHLTLPTAITQIVASSDGAYLYLLTEDWSTLELSPPIQMIRVRTADMTIDQTVALTSFDVLPTHIAVSPIDSNTWSAAFPSEGDVWTVEIFDGAAPRPNVWSITSNLVYSSDALWSADGSKMYILDANLNAVLVTASGLGSGTQLQPGNEMGFDYGGNIQLAGGRIYSDGGGVLDPDTNTILGNYVFPSDVPFASLTVDAANNRTFATYSTLVNDMAQETIQSFNLSSFAPIWIARLPIASSPLRWGADGLAWIGPGTNGAALYLINGTFVAP